MRATRSLWHDSPNLIKPSKWLVGCPSRFKFVRPTRSLWHDYSNFIRPITKVIRRLRSWKLLGFPKLPLRKRQKGQPWNSNSIKLHNRSKIIYAQTSQWHKKITRRNLNDRAKQSIVLETRSWACNNVPEYDKSSLGSRFSNSWFYSILTNVLKNEVHRHHKTITTVIVEKWLNQYI